MSLATRWIVCTKWAIPYIPKAKVDKDAPPPDKSTAVASKPEYYYFWTPIGTPQYATKRGKHSGIPASYSTEQEAILGLKDVVNQEPELLKQNLKFVAVQVRYVPNKIKVYKQDWFNKYAVSESELDFAEHKFTDKIQ